MVHCLGISLCVYYLGCKLDYHELDVADHVDDQNLLNGLQVRLAMWCWGQQLTLQAINQWQDFFGRPSAEQLGLATSSIFFSAVPFAFVADFISGRYGRKWAIRAGASLIVSRLSVYRNEAD